MFSVHKKDDKKEISNYRPVSLLPSTSKIYERIVHSQLMTFLEEHHLLDDNQHGFRNGRSTISAAVEYLESIIDSVDKGEHALGIFMDLSKAFDSVDHSILIKKLNYLGINLNNLKWFQSYLTNRVQYVEIPSVSFQNKISRVSSEPKTIISGVPQGSILGPLLFLCYLKDMHLSLKQIPQEHLCLYADDANLKFSSKSVDEIEKLSHIELNNVNCFLNEHNLKLNVKKTNYMTFKTQQRKEIIEPSIKVNHLLVTKNQTTKFLGLTIDENLNWDQHVQILIAKLNSGIYALTKMSFICNTDTLRMIYFSYIHSHIAYGLCLYGATKNSNLDEILRIQKKSLRIMLGLKIDDSVKEYFKKLKILTVYGQYILDTIMCSKFKNLNTDTANVIHSYNTRHKTNILISRHRLNFFTKKPTYIGSKFLKSIPLVIKQETESTIFKRKLKAYLLDKALYSLDEYFDM
uniref:Reverse transcriptase domain-containing protein n=1 Tax=Graphocephala atropunctata TaxID=36148 RepID=A0A1B6MAK8_9HEMI